MAHATDAVHAGERPDPADGAVNQSIVNSTTFRYPELPDGGKSPYIYARYENPTTESIESKLATLEGSESALAFSSGMAAIQAVCQVFAKSGSTVAVQRGVYGGTMAFLRDELAPRGVKIHVFDAEASEPLPANVSLVWLESITNPLLRVPNISGWAKAAHDAGAKLCVDATFATPIIQRPLELGADLVIHSGTKYLGGHTDVTSGFVCCSLVDRQALWLTRRNLGAVLDPLAAYLVGRGMKTLPLRVEQQCKNAAKFADALADAGVKVHYPGRPEHADSARVPEVLAAPGAMVTIELPSLQAAQHFRRTTRLITPASSLGGVESLCSLPIETSHAYATAESRAEDGITDGLVRISIGVEDVEDLIADALQALEAA